MGKVTKMTDFPDLNKFVNEYYYAEYSLNYSENKKISELLVNCLENIPLYDIIKVSYQ